MNIPRWRWVAILTAIVLGAGCSANPADLPLPGTGVGEHYSVDIQFASVLNLPTKANVSMNGLRVGVVRSVTLGGPPIRPHAIATVDIDRRVPIPTETRAELRQATVLGDIYVALIPPATAPDSSMMADGGVIDINHTAPPQQVEDLLAGMATLVNGGMIGDIQRTIEQMNAAFPAEPAAAATAIADAKHMLADLADNATSLGNILQDSAQIVDSLRANGPQLVSLLDIFPHRVQSLFGSILALFDVLAQVGENMRGVGTLVNPRAAALTQIVGVLSPLLATVSQLDAGAPGNLAKIRKLLDEKIIPLTAAPSVEITSITDPTHTDVTGQVVSILRMVGAVR